MLDSTFAPQHVNGTEYNAETAQNWPEYVNQRDNQQADDHFVTRNGKTFAGTHIIIDLWGAERLDDLELMEATLRDFVAYPSAPFYPQWRHFGRGGTRRVTHFGTHMAGTRLCCL